MIGLRLKVELGVGLLEDGTGLHVDLGLVPFIHMGANPRTHPFKLQSLPLQ